MTDKSLLIDVYGTRGTGKTALISLVHQILKDHDIQCEYDGREPLASYSEALKRLQGAKISFREVTLNRDPGDGKG